MNFRIFFLFLMVISESLFGGIEKHLKSVPNKSDDHRMDGIDFIYMINLDQRPEKFAQSAAQLEPYGIYPYRFSAVNGWELSETALNELGVTYHSWMCTDLMGTCYLPGHQDPVHELMQVRGRRYYSHCLSRGAIGIVLSHLSILKDAYDNKYDRIWVMEDDIEVKKDPHLITSLINELDDLVGEDNWDILFTDPNTKNHDGTYIPCTAYARRPNFEPVNPERFNQTTVINNNFKKDGARYGAYSMIINRTGIKKLLRFLRHHKVFLPYDLEYYLPNDIQLYSMRYDVVSTLPQALSDNGAPRYEKKK